MHDNYHYLSGEEFFNRFQDRIPEDLQPRIEAALLLEISEDKLEEFKNQQYDIECLEERKSTLECKVDTLEDNLFYSEKEITKLREEIESLRNALIDRDLEIEKLKRFKSLVEFNHLTPI